MTKILDKNSLRIQSISRVDPDLVAVLEQLGPAANGFCADLCIRELPPGTKYVIDRYDGLEAVVTPNEFDWKTA